jgi:hypothetical protein
MAGHAGGPTTRLDAARSPARAALGAGAGALIFAASYLYRDPTAQGPHDLIAWLATWLLTGR